MFSDEDTLEMRVAVLDRLKANDGRITLEDLLEIGIYTEEELPKTWWQRVLATVNFGGVYYYASTLEEEYRLAQYGTTLHELSLEYQEKYQQQVQMYVYYLVGQYAVKSVHAYNADGSAIREKGATSAEKGYESVSSDYKPFNYKGTRYATDASKPVVGGDILAELDAMGVKYNADNIVLITKDTSGNIRWLETGNARSGLEHIMERHGGDLARRGITDIPRFVEEVIQSPPINSGANAVGPFSDYLIDGYTYRMAYGENGYIVSFYPIK